MFFRCGNILSSRHLTKANNQLQRVSLSYVTNNTPAGNAVSIRIYRVSNNAASTAMNYRVDNVEISHFSHSVTSSNQLDFATTANLGWSESGGTIERKLHVHDNRLELKQAGGAYVSKQFVCEPGVQNTIELDIERRNPFSGNLIITVVNPSSGLQLASLNLSTTSGAMHPVINFTPSGGTVEVRIYNPGEYTLVDNIEIYYNRIVIHHICDNTKDYRFGFNGQEKDNEISGVGNSYTAEFWQYDSRLGRRWNVDPIVKYWESPYASFYNSPILLNDTKGDDVDLSKLSKDEKDRINKMNDPSHSKYNKDFAEVYKRFEGDKSSVYTFNTMDIGIEKGIETIYGSVTYGGLNENAQDIIDINYTIGLQTWFNENFSLLEEVYHADQFRRGNIGFVRKNEGDRDEWHILGSDRIDEAEAKIWAIKSYNGSYSEEKRYIREYNKGGHERVATQILQTIPTYASLPAVAITALENVRKDLLKNNIELSDDEIFDSIGRSKIDGLVLRKPNK